MKELSIDNFQDYNCNLLQPVEITPTEILRDKIILASGEVVYGNKRLGTASIKFKGEFKGTRQEIEQNKSKFINDFELCKFTFKDRVYEGSFVCDGIEEIFDGFEVLSIVGICNVYDTKINTKELKNNGVIGISLSDMSSTPFFISITGTGNNININSEDFKILIPQLKGTIKIDARDKIVLDGSNENAYKSVQMLHFPFSNFKKTVNIRVFGSGNYTTRVTYQERLI